MDKKTILFVIESLHCGGAEKSLVTLLSNFDYSKFQVDLLLIKKGGEFEKFVPEQVTILYENSLNKISLHKKIKSKIKFAFTRKLPQNKIYNTAHLFWVAYGNLFKTIEKKYDFAIGYSQGFASYFVADKVIASKKYAWLNIDYDHAKHYAKYDYTKYKKLNKVVCVSPDCETSLHNAMTTTIGKTLKTTVIKDITDEVLVNKLSEDGIGFTKTNSNITILTVCRLAKQKGLYLAIDACKVLVDKGIKVKWYVVGEGTERAFLEQRILDNNLREHFILMGFKENPYPYMKTTDIYVQTSLFEGLGLTVIEAALLNKPIVCTNFPTSSSILNHEKTGLICEMKGYEIALHILKYVNDSEFTNTVISNLKNTTNNDKEISLKRFNALLN